MQISVIHPINKLKDKRLLIKDKNHMIISIDLEKSFNKIQYPFMLKKKKNLSRKWKRRNLPQHNKGHVQQTHRKHYFQWWKTESISSKIRNKKEGPLSPLLFNIILEVLVTAIREEKQIKGLWIGKEVKLSLSTDDKIMYVHRKS